MLEYCALALLASGRPVTREGLAEMCEFAGVPASERDIQAMALLLRAARPAQGETDGLRDMVKRLSELVASLERLVSEARLTAAPPTPQEPVLPATRGRSRARYIYGVVEGSGPCRLKTAGVGGAEVFPVDYNGLAAIVHACEPEPYSTTDDDAARAWVESHNSVLQECLELFESVVPCTFNTIIHDPGDSNPDDIVKGWLKKQEQELRERLDRVRGKREFSVQILCDREALVSELAQSDPDLAALKRVIEDKSPGAAYMFREKFERVLKEKVESLLLSESDGFLERVRPHCADLKIDRCRKSPDGGQMIANWSCLLTREGERAVGMVLEEIRGVHGHQVRFVGPLPPYSFV